MRENATPNGLTQKVVGSTGSYGQSQYSQHYSVMGDYGAVVLVE